MSFLGKFVASFPAAGYTLPCSSGKFTVFRSALPVLCRSSQKAVFSGGPLRSSNCPGSCRRRAAVPPRPRFQGRFSSLRFLGNPTVRPFPPNLSARVAEPAVKQFPLPSLRCRSGAAALPFSSGFPGGPAKTALLVFMETAQNFRSFSDRLPVRRSVLITVWQNRLTLIQKFAILTARYLNTVLKRQIAAVYCAI